MIIVTIACPENLTYAGNELAKVLGFSEEDGHTYGHLQWTDAENNKYSVASGLVSEAFLTAVSSPLVEPPWGADMEAAALAQSKVRIWTFENPIVASPDLITATVGIDPLGSVGILGLSIMN